MIEDLIGEEVNAFRAPGFSITKNNTWALRCLGELGFEYDCSMFPAPHDYGGMPSYGMGVPKRIDYLGVKTDVYADAKNNFYWVGSRVDNAELNARIEKEITKYFNQSPVEVVSYSVTINEYNIFAVKSGGVIFAQIIETAD